MTHKEQQNDSLPGLHWSHLHFLLDSGPIVAFSFVFSELDQVDDLASQDTPLAHTIK